MWVRFGFVWVRLGLGSFGFGLEWGHFSRGALEFGAAYSSSFTSQLAKEKAGNASPPPPILISSGICRSFALRSVPVFEANSWYATMSKKSSRASVRCPVIP